MILILECSNCGDFGQAAILKGTEFEWIEDTLEGGEAICEPCAREIAHEADMDNRQYQESRADHEDGVWDGEHFYPDNTIADNR
tara:strand:- start:4937 stop:5188 length:252 start_codon:yes stop_codon:yes gene_type:complete